MYTRSNLIILNIHYMMKTTDFDLFLYTKVYNRRRFKINNWRSLEFFSVTIKYRDVNYNFFFLLILNYFFQKGEKCNNISFQQVQLL